MMGTNKLPASLSVLAKYVSKFFHTFHGMFRHKLLIGGVVTTTAVRMEDYLYWFLIALLGTSAQYHAEAVNLSINDWRSFIQWRFSHDSDDWHTSWM